MKLVFAFVLITCSVDALAIRPDREYKRTPADFGLAYSEYQVTTPDQYSINVWEYGTGDLKPKRTVIFVGTDAGNMSYFLWQAKAFVESGVRVVSFDYRGFGKSSDFNINTNFLFYNEYAIDLDSVIRDVRAKYPESRIGLYSLSMGTYISLIRKEKIDFLIQEGFYSDPIKVTARIKEMKGKDVALPDPARIMTKLKPRVPLLIFCASKDQTTITQYAKDFSKKNKVTVIEFEGVHLAAFAVLTKEKPGDIYMEKVISFLDSVD